MTMDHKPLSEGQDLQSRQYDPEGYQQEKALGGRLPNGAQRIGRIRPWHVQCAKMHIQGYSNRHIATALGKNEAVVCKVLKDPRVEAWVQRAVEGWEKEFQSLKGRAIDAIRGGLNSNDVEVRLKAADSYFRQEEKEHKKSGSSEQSAEDVVSAIFERIDAEVVNVQINTSTPSQVPSQVPENDSNSQER